MDKYAIIDEISARMADSDNNAGGWSDGIDGMIVSGGYVVVCDKTVDGWENGYYICSLEAKDEEQTEIVADVWVNGDSLSIDIRECEHAIDNSCKKNGVSYPGHDFMENGICIFCGKKGWMNDAGEWVSFSGL